MIKVKESGRSKFIGKARNELLKLDLFQRHVPQLNHQGNHFKASYCGIAMSLLIITIMLLYGMLKLEELVTRKNPLINFNENPKALDSSDKLNLHQNGHKFAFTVHRQNGDSKLNHRYIKFMVLFEGLMETRFGSR